MPTSQAGLAERRCLAAIEEAVQSAAGVAVDFKAARRRELGHWYRRDHPRSPWRLSDNCASRRDDRLADDHL